MTSCCFCFLSCIHYIVPDHSFQYQGTINGKVENRPDTAYKAHEPPLPLYIGFNVHAMTRSRTLIAKLYQMGISVFYQRIMKLEDMLATSISERFEMDGCVAPACLRKGVFTIGALDNLDHNPSSTTATSFHGTGISVFQLPTENNPGEERPPVPWNVPDMICLNKAQKVRLETAASSILPKE
ncbi:hypothetical protein OS493_010564 [Desmophyllum pertusum]|uniref:Uncharacterized protein n=1 Tax=Desmophyllum pertusum TaxID=174260 RepID=A0A9X0D4F9_9CNID|nr:hypothetical protein OS493_010564 [Desmophyllum pertusum]